MVSRCPPCPLKPDFAAGTIRTGRHAWHTVDRPRSVRGQTLHTYAYLPRTAVQDPRYAPPRPQQAYVPTRSRWATTFQNSPERGPDDHAASPSRVRATAYPVRGRHAVPRRPEDGHPVGQGRQAHLDPHARRPPPLPRVRGPLAARGQHPRHDRRLRTWPQRRP